MKAARVIVLGVAVVAAAGAGHLALKLAGQEPAVVEVAPTVERVEMEEVLIANQDLPIGTILSGDNVDWQEWPKDAVVDEFITRSTAPEAVTNLEGSIVRLPIFTGEPIRNAKIVDENTRIMSSILPAGKRAVAVQISVDTAAGGFILPNDRVDVIMVRRSEEAGFITETILSNIRVLAIDQIIQEDDNGKTAIGSTATLELTPEQAKIIAVAQQMADRLTLALRSVADVQAPDTGGATHLLSGDGQASTIKVIKSGTIMNVGTN